MAGPFVPLPCSLSILHQLPGGPTSIEGPMSTTGAELTLSLLYVSKALFHSTFDCVVFSSVTLISRWSGQECLESFLDCELVHSVLLHSLGKWVSQWEQRKRERLDMFWGITKRTCWRLTVVCERDGSRMSLGFQMNIRLWYKRFCLC